MMTSRCVLLDAEQGHQRDDAAFAVIVDAHGKIDVFDAGDDEEGPQDQRQRAEDRGGVRLGARQVQNGFQRIEGARADIAEDDAERRQAQGGDMWIGLRRRDRTCLLARHAHASHRNRWRACPLSGRRGLAASPSGRSTSAISQRIATAVCQAGGIAGL